MSRETGEKILMGLVLVFVVCAGIFIVLADNGYTGSPVYYNVGFYPPSGEIRSWRTRKVVTHEFSGTYSFLTDDNKYIEIPVEDTVIEEEK